MSILKRIFQRRPSAAAAVAVDKPYSDAVVESVGAPEVVATLPESEPFVVEQRSEAPTAPVTLRMVERDKRERKVPAAPPDPILRVVGKPTAPTATTPAAEAEAIRAAVKKVVREEGQKRADAKPRTDQRALYYQFMDGLYDAVLLLDEDGYVVDVNKRVQDVLGYTRESAWDLPIEKVVLGMTRPMFEHLKRTAREQHNLLIDARCCRNDGTTFAGEAGVSELCLNGNFHIVFAVRNVERLKSKLMELKRFEAAFDASLTALFICDHLGIIQHPNSCALELLGAPSLEALQGRRLSAVVPLEDATIERAVEGEAARQTLTLKTPQGESTYQLVMTPVYTSGRVTGLLVALYPTNQPTNH